MEERREETKVLSGKKLERIEASWLVKMVVKKLRDGGIGWWEEYEILRRMFELVSEVGSEGR